MSARQIKGGGGGGRQQQKAADVAAPSRLSPAAQREPCTSQCLGLSSGVCESSSMKVLTSTRPPM